MRAPTPEQRVRLHYPDACAETARPFASSIIGDALQAMGAPPPWIVWDRPSSPSEARVLLGRGRDEAEAWAMAMDRVDRQLAAGTLKKKR